MVADVADTAPRIYETPPTTLFGKDEKLIVCAACVISAVRVG